MSQSTYSGSSKKRDPEQLEQLASRLRYAEESIAQRRLTTTKNEDRAKKDIKKKTKENTSLLVDLNALKF